MPARVAAQEVARCSLRHGGIERCGQPLGYARPRWRFPRPGRGMPDVKTSDFDYELPPHLIAQEPLAERDASRLLVMRRQTTADSRKPMAEGRQRGPITHHVFSDLPDFIQPGDVLAVN